MVSFLTITRGGKIAFRSYFCLVCQAQQVGRREFTAASFRRSAFSPNLVRRAVPYKVRQNENSKSRKSPQEIRTEIDTIARASYYRQCHQSRIICMPEQVADAIIADFLAARQKGPAQNVATDIATKHELEVSDIVKLAIATFRIPDKPDLARRLPPSQHGEIAKEILLACSRAYNVDAVLEILLAVYWGPSIAGAQQIASHFSPREKETCRGYLEHLAMEKHPDAMTLAGAFLEREGKERRARELYEAALELQSTIKFDPRKVHQLSLPRIPTWNALGMLLLSKQDPKSQEQAKQVFKRGALEGDDPFAYFHLASFEEKPSGLWLQYMSKAAGSGHVEAMYELGRFYVAAKSNENHWISPEYLKDGILTKALNWLTESPRYVTTDVGLAWFELAANGGHKPAMLESATIWESRRDRGKATEYLRKIAAPPSMGTVEQWPELVNEANKRLATIRR